MVKLSVAAACAAFAPLLLAGDSITNLYDAFGKPAKGSTFDWGYAALVRYHGKTILFDAGNNADVLAANANALGIDLTKIDLALLSHRHNDHAAGFDYVFKANPALPLYLPPDNSLGDFGRIAVPPAPEGLPEEFRYYGGKQPTRGTTGRFWKANVTFVTASREVMPGVFLIVTESPLLGDFSRYPPNDREPRLMGFHELSLALVTSQGVVVVTGCSHSRVENIVAETKKVTGRPVHLVTGGFHLLPYQREEITRLANHLKNELKVERVAPAHCTGGIGFQVLRETYGQDFLFAGLETVLPLPD